MHASVIIPTHNRKHILSRVLGFYACQVEGTEEFELVIVDDGSEDATDRLFKDLGDIALEEADPLVRRYRDIIETARKGWVKPVKPAHLSLPGRAVHVRYIKIMKSGRSKARNVGIGFAAYPLIVFADDDIFVEPGFVKKHGEAHTPEDRLVVMGRVIHTHNLVDPFSARWKLKDINTAFLATGNASILKRHLIEAGLFDEWYTIYGWEDFDLGIHLQENGLVSVKEKVYGYHYDPSQGHSGQRPEGIYEKERERGLSAVYFYRNHPLPWVRRFTLVENRVLKALVNLFGRNNWFLKKKRFPLCTGFFRLIIRYKGYFDGVEQGLKIIGVEEEGV